MARIADEPIAKKRVGTAVRSASGSSREGDVRRRIVVLPLNVGMPRPSNWGDEGS